MNKKQESQCKMTWYIFVNKKVVKRKLPVVRPRHMFQSENVQDKLDTLEFSESEYKPDRTGYFQAYAVACKKTTEAHLAQVRARQMHPEATHIVSAFNPSPESAELYAFQDDGEFGAGLRLIRFLKENNYHDVVVCVVRHYGGVNLGPRRFQLMTELAKEALDKL